MLSTLAYALLFVLLRGPLGSQAANAVALAITGVANTQANRRVTFRLRGRARLLSDHLRGFAVFVLALAISDAALSALHAVADRPPRGVELAVLVIAGLGATVTRFVALKVWVFRRARRTPEQSEPTNLLNPTNQEI